MTDSMKFGPEWLRNKSSEPPNSSSVVVGSTSTLTQNNNAVVASHTPAPRNMFPEFRYGREEMLSLFDRNHLLPQILTSYKKLFVEKVQYPLALTPSTEDEVNAQGATGTSSRPPWLQRSPVGFGISPRGTGRGGTADRGRMRGKSVYHSIYQRPPALYEDGISPLSLKPERAWSERNGTNELSSIGGASGSLDWNGTPTSSPRKEFSSHPRNMENWRRSRNEDGSGDGPSSGGIASTDGWRSGNHSGGGSSGFGNTHRWGRSTSWRDEDSAGTANNNDSSAYSNINMQRSISTIGTVGPERQSGGYLSNNIGKTTTGGGSLATSRTLGGTSHAGKASQQWSTGAGGGNPEADDNLPEWAMENPSDVGGTFDASGAFHGEGTDDELQKRKSIEDCERESSPISETKSVDGDDKEGNSVKISQIPKETDVKPSERLLNANIHCVPTSKLNSPSNEKIVVVDQPCEVDDRSVECGDSQDKQKVENNALKNIKEEQQVGVKLNDMPTDLSLNSSVTAVAVELKPESLGDISERMKEVADEVEKLIMDDDGGVMQNNTKMNIPASTTSSEMNSYASPVLAAVMMKQTSQVEPTRAQHTEALPTNVLAGMPHKSLPFAESLAIHQHLAQQQQQLSTAGNLPPQVLNPNSDDFWYYRDPQSNIQGPFSAIEMTEWYRAGYFNESLFVRRVCDTRFRPLGELIKICHGNMPFTHSHLIPSSLEMDSLQMVGSNKSAAIALNDVQQQRNEEQLKGNVTAAADSLSAAVKNHISSMGMSHMLTMQFQMLQDQYMQHQEHNILAELSKNDCFQRLTQPEREAVIRQKVQMLVLPEYLSSFSGLSNSLAALNPIAGNQLYDVIAEHAKKDQQQQQHNIYTGNSVPHPPRLEADDFIMNAQLVHQQQSQQQQQQQYSGHFCGTEGGKVGPGRAPEELSGGNNLLNFPMFLGGGANTTQQSQPKSNPIDFMAEPQIMNSATGGGQNIMMPMWLPQFGPNGQQSLNANQPAAPILAAEQTLQQQQQQQQHGQWGGAGSVLVGMPNADLTPKPMSVTLWDVAALEQAQNQQLMQKRRQNLLLEQTINNMPFNDISDNSHQLEMTSESVVKQQQAAAQPQTVPHHQHLQNKQRKEELQIGMQLPPVQQQQQHQQMGSSKAAAGNGNGNNNGKQHQSQPAANKSKIIQDKQINEEERRRELAEEKRRQKEDRKRQQLEEEKRRAQQAEDEKRRQMQEEKERQLQIQAQRRKALLGSASAATILQTSKPNTKGDQQQQRSHSSSIAPWSLQTGVSQSLGPGLAEIQKAERRERRADMQRQQEQQDKQLRANAVAAAEANEAMLKWQAPPAPTQVMSLDEIQAEEAKRLAEEQLEQQRRREQDQQQQSALVASAGLVGNTAGGLSNIWGNTSKAWSGTVSSTNSLGPISNTFWEETLKFNNSAANNGNNASTVAAVLASGLQTSSNRQQQQQHQHQSKASVSPSARNLRKSQTVPAIQTVAAAAAAATATATSIKTGKSGNGLQQQQEKSKLVVAQSKPNKSNDDKRVNTKQNVLSNKATEYENEFTSWCMKSLTAMSAKVDVPTFVTFLQDLEAPYEVKDYVRIYLGEGKESTDFAKQFLERRSKYKNLQRAQNAHNDDMCKPAPAITPSGNDNSDTKNKQKKIKKNKMTKLDARILGFSVTAAEGRINVGDRDYVDAP